MGNVRTDTLLHHIRRLADEPSAAVPTDDELLHRFVTLGEEEAFAALLRRHGPMVLHVCRRVLHHGHDAEDAFQATFLVLARKAKTLRRPEAVGSWLYGVAYRVACNARSAAARRVTHESGAAPGTGTDPLAEISLREAQAVLDAELSRLPERYRAPLVLCCLEGMARDEAARQLGWPLGTLKSRLERGRQFLRTRLTRRGLTVPTALAATLFGQGLASADLPGGLADATLGAALAWVGQAAAGLGAPSPAALALADGMVRALAASKLKLGVAVLLTAGLLAASAGLLMHPTAPPDLPPGQPARSDGDKARVEVGQEKLARTDRYSDPLPEGALLRLGSVRFRRAGALIGVVVSPDGKWLATGGCGGWGSSKTFQLWDATTGKASLAIPWIHLNYGPAQNLLAFSADGQRLFFPNTEGAAVRDLTTGQTQVVLPVGKEIKINAVHPSPDGKLLAVGTSAGVQVVDLANGRALWDVRNRPETPRDGGTLLFDGPYSIGMFAPNGKLVAVYTSDTPTAIRLLDSATGAERRHIDLRNWVVRLAFSADGRHLATTEHGSLVRVYEVATGRRLHSWTLKLTDPYLNYTADVAFSPDGAMLAAGATDHLIHRWDLHTGKELPPLRGHNWKISGLAFAPDGKWLYSVGWDNTIHRWEAATGRLQPVNPDGGTGEVACSPVGPVAAWEGTGGVIHLQNTATGRKLRTLPGNPAGLTRLGFSPDGAILVAAGRDMSIQLWEVATGKLVRHWSWPKGPDTHAGVDDLAFSPDSKLLATASFRTHEVVLWDLRTGSRLGTAPHRRAHGVAFTPDGRAVVSVGSEEPTRWWDLPKLQPRDETLTSSGWNSAPRFSSIRYSPDGRWLVTYGYFYVWDATTHQLLHHFESTGGQCNFEFSPDSQWVAIGGDKGEVGLWEVRTGQQVLKLAGHPVRVHTVAFGYDGRTLLTGSDDNTGLIWDLRPKMESPDEPSVAALWDALAGKDAAAAYRAVWRLAGRPDRSVPFLKEKLTPAKPVDRQRLPSLLDQFDSENFAEREAAMRQLSAWGEAIAPELRHALTQKPSLEKRARLQNLLDTLTAGGSPEDVRRTRAVIVLTWAKTPAARRFLGELAQGAPEARLTREAKAALKRSANWS